MKITCFFMVSDLLAEEDNCFRSEKKSEYRNAIYNVFNGARKFAEITNSTDVYPSSELFQKRSNKISIFLD